MMDALDVQTTQCHISGHQNSCHAVLNCARACMCRIIERTTGRILRICIAGPHSHIIPVNLIPVNLTFALQRLSSAEEPSLVWKWVTVTLLYLIVHIGLEHQLSDP